MSYVFRPGPITPDQRERHVTQLRSIGGVFDHIANFVEADLSIPDLVEPPYGPVCCTDGCCGPGSYCCARANPHTHEEEL